MICSSLIYLTLNCFIPTLLSKSIYCRDLLEEKKEKYTFIGQKLEIVHTCVQNVK